MTNFNHYRNLAKVEEAYGQIAGEQCTVNRVGSASISNPPNFAVSDQTPNKIATYKYYIETTSSKSSMVKAHSVEFYTIKGKRGVLKPGDILSVTKVTNPLTTTPDITFLNYFPSGECIGFKTTRVGAIYNGQNLLFNNIRFEFLPTSSFPGSPLDREIEASLGVPSIQAVTFKKPLLTTTQDPEGLFLYQIDTTPNIVWQITQVNEYQNLTIYDLKKNVIG